MKLSIVKMLGGQNQNTNLLNSRAMYLILSRLNNLEALALWQTIYFICRIFVNRMRGILILTNVYLNLKSAMQFLSLCSL